MNTIREIDLQNQQDFWTYLYIETGKSLKEVCGRGAEGVIRAAVRNMSVEKGKRLRKEYEAAGIKANLQNLYAGENACSADVRVRQQILKEGEEIRLWEVYTCPMALIWQHEGCNDLGMYYCEENQRGLVAGFTEGAGQVNLTKKLTCSRTNGTRPDNHCRFSAYFRMANTPKEKRDSCFTGYGIDGPREQIEKKDFRTRMKEQCTAYMTWLTKEALEAFGEEGRCAVAIGLRNLAERMTELMLWHAEATLNACTREFVHRNLPIGPETEDALWDGPGAEEAQKLFCRNFLDVLNKNLKLG